jgi:tetratricopeptide (TPR) repeat protein
VKLLDFGIAKVSGSELTRDGESPGTISYMSPEQVRGATVDARTDIWSLGVVLYEMLVGVRPFSGETQATVLQAILASEPEPIGSLRPDVPLALGLVVSRLLAKDVGERYTTAAEVLADLESSALGVSTPGSVMDRLPAGGDAAAAPLPGAGSAPARGPEHVGAPSSARGVVDVGAHGSLVRSGPPALPPELIARSAELGQLMELVRAACEGTRQVVLVHGEPGIGKSALAEALLARAPAGVRIARGYCLEQRGAGEPYLPVLDALGRLCRGVAGAGVVRQLEASAPTWLVQMPWLLAPEQLEAARHRSYGATRERMLRELGEALEALSRDTPLVLLLEDLHWSDPSTLDLIAWIGQRPEPARLLVLGTFRPGDAESHLRSVIGQVRRSGRLTEIALQRWSEADLRDYCGRRSPARAFPDELLSLAHWRSDGNPLFVQTLLDSWIQGGALVESDEGWIATRALEALAAEIPESLRRLLEQRVEQLPADEQQILEAASLAGPVFSSAVVAAALEVDEEGVETCCHALAQRGHLLRDAGTAEWPDGTLTARFAFAHHLFQDALSARVPLTRRARLHLRVGKRLEAAYGADVADQASELALHFRHGRDAARAVRYLRLSAEQACRRSAQREAVGHLTAALDLLKQRPLLPDALSLELDLQRMLGQALLLTRGWGDPDAERALIRAREISEQLNNAAQLAQVLHGMAYIHEIRGDFHQSQPLLEQCLGLGEAVEGPYTTIESHELLSCSLFHQGKFEGALQSARAAIAAFRPAEPGDPFAASLGMNASVASHYWAGLALWCLGHPDEALNPLEDALRTAEHSQLIYMQASAHGQAAQLYQFRRELSPLIAHAEEALELSHRQGYPFHHAIALTLRGWARVVEGAVEDGLEEIRRGLATQAAAGADMERPYGLGLLAEALLYTGRTEEGLTAVDEAEAIIHRRARSFFWEAELHRLRGELLLRKGATEAAESSLREALAIAGRQGARSLELRAAMSLCRLRCDRDGRGEARETLAGIYAGFTEGLNTPDLREAAAMLEASA